MKLSIARRLFLVCAALVAALAALAVAGWMRLDEVALLAQRASDIRAHQLMRVADMELTMTRVSLQMRDAMLSRSPEKVAQTLADVQRGHRHIDAVLEAYRFNAVAEAGNGFVANAAQTSAQFWRVGDENIALIAAGKMDEAYAFLSGKTMSARGLFLGALAAEKQRQLDSLLAEVEQVEANARAIGNMLGAAVAVLACCLLGFSWHVARLLGRRLQQARLIAERVRDGNLTVAVRDAARDEISPLLTALGAMQDALVKVVGAVRQGAEGVAAASAEMAHGNHDLSSRTERQACALEQTASAMDALGATVRQNAGHASQANALAITASTVAIAGGEVVGQVVETMKGINDSSARIADIIGVIDAIAFQTNILALNAAVEAARAGEQGRGFAVVAAEVRSLARRSADAAKEIKQLIATSVQRVEQGALLVDRAGATMAEVVTSIAGVASIVGQISTASAEQSDGVVQIGQAISEMDRSTQQNAAMVEQVAAAAADLKSQSGELVQVVAVFRIPANGGFHEAARLASAPAVVGAIREVEGTSGVIKSDELVSVCG